MSQAGSPIDTVARVRAARGLEPINPAVIQGDLPSSPPPVHSEPDLGREKPLEPKDSVMAAKDIYGDPVEPEFAGLDGPVIAPNPLLELGRKPAAPQPPEAPRTEAKLWISDATARYETQTANLDEREIKLIAQVVIKAAQRELTARLTALNSSYVELTGRRPRQFARRRRKKSSSTTKGGASGSQ